MSAVQADRRVLASFIQSQAQALHSIDLEARQRSVYRAKQYVREELDGADNVSYKKLPGLLAVCAELNPGSVVKCESTYNGQFLRCVIVFEPATAAWGGMQRILGIDGAYCKSNLYSGVQLVVVGRDGSMYNVRVACALVPSESEDDCLWFLQACTEGGVPLNVPAMSDRGSGIIAAARRFGIQLEHCAQRILRNIRHRFPTLFRDEHTNIIWTMQGALERHLYDFQLALLGIACGEKIKRYVASISTCVCAQTSTSSRCTAVERPTSSKVSTTQCSSTVSGTSFCSRPGNCSWSSCVTTSRRRATKRRHGCRKSAN